MCGNLLLQILPVKRTTKRIKCFSMKHIIAELYTTDATFRPFRNTMSSYCWIVEFVKVIGFDALSSNIVDILTSLECF